MYDPRTNPPSTESKKVCVKSPFACTPCPPVKSRGVHPARTVVTTMHSCTVQRGDRPRGEMTAQRSPARFSHPGWPPPSVPGRDRDRRPRGPGRTPGQRPEVSTRRNGQARARVPSPPLNSVGPWGCLARPARPGPSPAVAAVCVDGHAVGLSAGMPVCSTAGHEWGGSPVGRGPSVHLCQPDGGQLLAGLAAPQAGTPQAGSAPRTALLFGFWFVLSLYNH